MRVRPVRFLIYSKRTCLPIFNVSLVPWAQKIFLVNERAVNTIKAKLSAYELDVDIRNIRVLDAI